MKQIPVILLFICVAFSSAKGQEVKVTATFDTSRIFIGDQTGFTVTVDKPVSFILSIPVFKDSLVKNIEILKGPAIDTATLKDGRIRIIQKYLVTSFDSGFYQVPPVYAEMTNENGIKRFYSDYSPLEVMRVKIAPPDTASKIFDIISPYKAPVTLGEILPWILILILAGAATWYLVRVIRKLRLKKTGVLPEPDPDPDPAHVIAFRQLEQLKAEKLWEKGEIKPYYTRLTEILRLYLENRFGILSLELTTYETLAALKRSGFKEDESYRKLKSVLTGADLVKFAKFNPDASEHELQYVQARDFVDMTKLEEVITVKIAESESNEEKR
jgi:hypothetical protein